MILSGGGGGDGRCLETRVAVVKESIFAPFGFAPFTPFTIMDV